MPCNRVTRYLFPRSCRSLNTPLCHLNLMDLLAHARLFAPLPKGIKPVTRRLCTAGTVSAENLRLRSTHYDAPPWSLSPMPCVPFWGQYVAEGHSADRFSLISTREAAVQEALEDALSSVGIPFSVVPTATL